MIDLCCPWCEAQLAVETEQVDEQVCPDCLTSWRYVNEEPLTGMAAAA
jgi:uncharacterized protein YbaR (Trm112 family)